MLDRVQSDVTVLVSGSWLQSPGGSVKPNSRGHLSVLSFSRVMRAMRLLQARGWRELPREPTRHGK